MKCEFNNFMSMEGKRVTKATAAVVHSPAGLSVRIDLADGTSCSLWFKLEKDVEQLDEKIPECFHTLGTSSFLCTNLSFVLDSVQSLCQK